MSEEEFEEVVEEEGALEEGGEQGGDLGGLSVEEQAKIAGWNPDHPGGKSAEEFLARNQHNVGLLRGENEKLYNEIGTLKQGMTQLAGFLESREERARQAGYDKAIADQKAKMAQAVEDADTDAFHEADRNIQKLEKRREEDKVEPIIDRQDEMKAEIGRLVASHQSENPALFDLASKKEVWNREMSAQAKLGASFEDAMKAADKAVMQMFNIKRNIPGFSNDGTTKSGQVSKLSEIPGAKEAFETLKKKIPELTVEEYLADLQGVI